MLKVIGCNERHFRKARKEHVCDGCGKRILRKKFILLISEPYLSELED